MSILENLPHTATAKRRTRTQGSLGGSKDSYATLWTGKSCWQQPAGDNEVTRYEKRGIDVTNKVYFVEDPQLDERDLLVVTNALTSTTMTLEVTSRPRPDTTVGKGIAWKVLCKESTTGSTPT